MPDVHHSTPEPNRMSLNYGFFEYALHVLFMHFEALGVYSLVRTLC